MKKLKIFAIIFIVLCSFIVVSESAMALDDADANRDYLTNGCGYTCGGEPPLVKNIPGKILDVTELLYNTIMVIVPVAMILMGIIDLVKGIMSQKEDEIKKGRDSLVKRLVTGLLVFLIVMIVKLFTGIVAGNLNAPNIVDCMDCFIGGKDSCTVQICEGGI